MNKKASAFTVFANAIVDATYFALAETGTNYKLAALKIWEYVQAKIKGSASTLSDGGTIVLAANDYVISLVVTNPGGGGVTFSVGTAAAATDVLDGELIAAGETEVYVIHHNQASAGSLHFTLSADQLSVRSIKL